MFLCIALVDEVLERCVKRVHQFRIQVLDVIEARHCKETDRASEARYHAQLIRGIIICHYRRHRVVTDLPRLIRRVPSFVVSHPWMCLSSPRRRLRVSYQSLRRSPSVLSSAVEHQLKYPLQH